MRIFVPSNVKSLHSCLLPYPLLISKQYTITNLKITYLPLLVWMFVVVLMRVCYETQSRSEGLDDTGILCWFSELKGVSFQSIHLADESHGDQSDDLLAFCPASLYAWPLWSPHYNSFHTSRANRSSFFATCEKGAFSLMVPLLTSVICPFQLARTDALALIPACEAHAQLTWLT